MTNSGDSYLRLGPVYSLMLAAALVGCSSDAERLASDQPTPRVTQTVTASPTPTETATPDVTHYRLTTTMTGHPDVTFTIALNGNTIGTLNGENNSDVTPSVLPGDNAVVLSWTSDRPLQTNQKARLAIERKIPGQDAWTTVFAREVDGRTRVKQAGGHFTNEAIGDNSAIEATAAPGAATRELILVVPPA
ncbi:MAG: hypothetical protein U0931_19150 [Vulcanimicrobiota bacterium]